MFNLGRYEEALASFDKSLEIQPDQYKTWHFRSLALRNLGRYEEAIASFDKSLEIQPDYYQAWNDRSFALSNLGRYEEAIASYDQALKFKPNFHEAWNNRGYALFKLGQLEEALASCERAIELGDQSYRIFFKCAIALTALNRWEKGIITLEDAFNRFEDEDNAEAEDAELIIRNLFKNNQPAIWKTHITSLITLYNKHQALSTFAQGLVKSIPILMSEMVSQKAAQVWLELWQELGSYPEFQIPLRLLATAVRYREKSDKRVLLDLPIEERKLLEGLFKDGDG